MGTINAEVNSRAEEEEYYADPDPGRDRDARSEGESAGNQQERIDREDSPRSNFVGNGNGITGEMLRQLIDEYNDQVASKQQEKRRIDEEKRRIDKELKRLNSRIQEFNTLLEQLEANKKE